MNNFTPMLFKTSEHIFDDPHYIYEIKWDGFRCLASKKDREVTLASRNGWCMNGNFPEIVEELQQVPHDFIIDGELVVMKHDVTDFAILQWRGRLRKQDKISVAVQNWPATFVVFDILWLDGKNLTTLALLDRKKQLSEVLSPTERIMINTWVDGKGKELFAATKLAGHEGVVAKRKDSLYYPGKRINDWLKIKHWREEAVNIVGYKTNPDFGLLVTAPGKQISTVLQGITTEEREAFLGVAADLKTDTKMGIVSIRPLLKCLVQFKEWTEDGRLRHPRFVRFLI